MPRDAAEILRHIRERSGLSAEQLSTRAEWPATRWENIEKGNQPFKKGYLEGVLKTKEVRRTDPEYLELQQLVGDTEEGDDAAEGGDDATEGGGDVARELTPSQRPPDVPATNRLPVPVLMMVAMIVMLGAGVVVGSALLPLFSRTPDTVFAGDDAGGQRVAQAATQPPQPTYTPQPTHTPYPTQEAPNSTATPYPTHTSYPTQTPYPTYTPPPTATHVSTSTATPRPSVDLPFEDDFDAGLKPAWEVASGDWRIANGRLTTVTEDAPSCVMVGDASWRNYSVGARLSRSLVSDGVDVLVRAQDDYNGMLLELRSDVVRWHVVRNGQSTELTSAYAYYAHGARVLRIDVRDSFFSAFLDGEPLLSIDDSTYSGGKVGLRLRGASAESYLDDFSVRPLP